ncbi:MAG: hypothetical protein ACLQHK_00230 [Gallionellaceae bacterium]
MQHNIVKRCEILSNFFYGNSIFPKGASREKTPVISHRLPTGERWGEELFAAYQHKHSLVQDGIIRVSQETGLMSMEAEQLNALTNQLQDLRARSNELRRYL